MSHFKSLADSQSDRSVGEKKLRISGEEGPSMTELSGYNFKRQEFEIEYDNDAEQLLADMEFKDTDTNAEHELKLQVLRIYSKRYVDLQCTHKRYLGKLVDSHFYSRHNEINREKLFGTRA